MHEMLGWSRVTGWPDYTVKVGSIKGPTQKRTALPSSIFENFDFCPLRLLGSRAEKKKRVTLRASRPLWAANRR